VIVLEGTPGAGKTTLLGRLLEALPDRLAVFPEAQPPREAPSDAEVARHLLAEDRARIDAARTLTSADPGIVVASDRCHIGVLAYRYARCATGCAPWRDFDYALSVCASLGLVEGHREDSIIVLLVDPVSSVKRRVGFAHDRRYRIWYGLDFLTAYNRFLEHLSTWMPANAAAVIIHSVVDGQTGWACLLAALPSTTVLRPRRVDHPGQDRVLTCASACTATRSRVVLARGAATQLYTGAVHRQRPTGTIACLQSAQQVTAAWLAV
jgi:hypothetical protein